MELIQTITVGAGGAASIDFTAIPQTGTDLMLVLSLRSSGGGTNSTYGLTVNNLTAANYAWRGITNNSSLSSTGQTADNSGVILQGNTTANTFTQSTLYFFDYASTGTKGWSREEGVTSPFNITYIYRMTGALYNASIAGITSIKLTDTATFVQNSSASLYKITKGSGGATAS